MRRWTAGLLMAAACSCSAGDDGACEEADHVANHIRQMALDDGLTEPPCALSAATKASMQEARRAEYESACARYSLLRRDCDGD